MDNRDSSPPTWQRSKTWQDQEDVDYELEDVWLAELNAYPAFTVTNVCAGHPEPKKAMKMLGIGAHYPYFTFRVRDHIKEIADALKTVADTKVIYHEVDLIIGVECLILHTGTNQEELSRWWNRILVQYKYLGTHYSKKVK